MSHATELPDIFKNASTPQNQQQKTLEQQALDIISGLSAQYLDWTTTAVKKLQEALNTAHTLAGPDLDAFIRNNLYPTLHDIKGQGSTFGYPLMTTLGTHACAIVKENALLTTDHLSEIAKDIADMHTVLEQRLTDNGGQIGKKITQRLKKD